MNFWSRIYKPVMLAVAAALFCVVGQVQSRLNVDRKAMGLTKMDPLQNAPPVLAFTTVALGSFRGLIANALWMRLSDLQEEDKYFEMVQLAQWITELQPHMVAVWQFQAWNMAYNISVKCKDYEDRWKWVSRGIELLREGLRVNPNETRIYRDLSWLYQHKIGANLDDAHMLYKLHLAQEMQNVFGGGHPDFAELEHPTTPLWAERAKTLREKYEMDPKIVEKVDKDYGPFDWRLPDAYAVYWAEVGRENGRPEDQETLRRSIYQSLQSMMFEGGSLPKSVTNVTRQNFLIRPNLNQVPTISGWYENMIAEETNNPHGLQQNMQTAHKNFLKQAIYMLYEDGRQRDAQHWFNYLKTIYTNAFSGKEANITLDDFAVSQIITDNQETDQNKVTASIMAMLHREFICLIMEDNEQAVNYDNLAKLIYRHYYGKIIGSTKERLELKSVAEMKQFVLNQLLDPQTGLDPESRARLMTALNLPAPKPAQTAKPTIESSSRPTDSPPASTN